MRPDAEAMRYDPERGVYRDCPWCSGSGCLQCPYEADKAYRKAFPDGPKPIATFDTTTPEGVSAARKAIGREALEHAFGDEGDGVAEIVRNCDPKQNE